MLTFKGVELRPGPYASESFSQTDGSTIVTDSHFTTGRIFVVSGGDFAVHGSTFAQFSDAIINTSTNIIDAVNNWWGDASGPNHPDNPYGAGSRIIGNAFFVPFVFTNPKLATITHQ
jgi:hypothetical protein